MDWYLGNYWFLLLLLLLPLLASFLIRFLKWKKKKREIFADSQFHEQLFEKKSGFTKFFPALYLFGTLFLIFSIIDLLSGSEEIKTSQKLNNVIFMLDVSNSMNAEDINPSRLTEAKNLMLQTMQKMKSDKVGMVIFAGQATSIMPLTTDYSSAETYISGIETNSMITSFGIGTEEGAPVPECVFGQLMGYKSDINGQTVISKRQTEALKKMADATGGSYIDGNNINEAPDRILDALRKKTGSSETMVKSQNANHYYQYFLAVSLFFFFLIYLFNPKRDFNV